MRRRALYLGLSVLLIVFVFAIRLTNISAMGQQSPADLPRSASLIAGQQQHTFFAAQATTTGASRLYLSRDGRTWQVLPAPVPGRLTSIAVSPVDYNIVYVATDKGLFVSDDGGRQWQQRSVPASVTALTLDTKMADLAYVATAEPAIYRVTDQGTSWQQVSAKNPNVGRIDQLAVSPANNDIVFAVTDRGLFRSESVGETWTRVSDLSNSVTALAFSPHTPSVVYAGTHDVGLYRSRDNGETWTAANAGLDYMSGTSLSITALAVDTEESNKIYVATGYVLGHTQRVTSPAGLYASEDGANTWVRITQFEAGGPTIKAVLPGNNSTIQAITSEGIKSYTIELSDVVADLDSPDVQIRRRGARALTLVADLQIDVDALLAHLNDPDPRVGCHIAHALGHSGGKRAVDKLVDRVAHGEPQMQRRAIIALSELGSPDAVPVLAEAFHTDDDLAQASAAALMNAGTEEALSHLMSALRQEDLTPERHAAMEAFETAGDRAIPVLVSALDDDRATLRANAVETLGWIGNPRAIRPVRTRLDDSSARVRAAAAWALGELGDRQSLPRLRTLIQADESAKVRDSAEQAIARIESRPAQAPIVATPDSSFNLSLPDILPSETIAWSLLALAASGVMVLFIIQNRRRKSTSR